MSTKSKKSKHNYTSELELKSLLIRIKNNHEKRDIDNDENLSEKYNNVINKYIKKYEYITNLVVPPNMVTKRKNLKIRIKKRIVELSLITKADKASFERFGVIILLMIKNILRRPQFSGYTYKDDFYSDAVYKILKYLHNFDHSIISSITGQPVNAFAYISQYIHNSILFVINTKKKENDNLKNHIQQKNMSNSLLLDTMEIYKTDYKMPEETNILNVDVTIKTNLVDEIANLQDKLNQYDRINVFYHDYSISFEEYDKIKPLLNGKFSIMRKDKNGI